MCSTSSFHTLFAVLFLCFSSWAGKLDALSPQSPRHLYQVFFSSGAEGEPLHCRDCRMGVKAVRICREGEIGRGPSGGRPGVSDEGHPRERQALFWLMTGKPSYSSLPHIRQRRKKKKTLFVAIAFFLLFWPPVMFFFLPPSFLAIN